MKVSAKRRRRRPGRPRSGSPKARVARAARRGRARRRRSQPPKPQKAKSTRWQRLRRRLKAIPRWRWLAAASVSLVVLSGVLTLAAYRRFLGAAGPATEPVTVSWPDGLDADEAAELLHGLGLVRHRLPMATYLARSEGPSCFVPGPHLFPAHATPEALLAALCRDPERPHVKVTLIEGFHRFAMAKRLEKAGVVSEAAFLHATEDAPLLHRMGVEPSEHPAGASAEGFLFPATYAFPIDASPEEVMARLVGEMSRRVAQLTKRHEAGWMRLSEELGFTRRDLLTLASIVEKEAAVAEERPIIASVFLNRLRDPDYPHLQSDPTSMYGCRVLGDEVAACRDWDGRPSGAINRDPDNVFSTYVTKGLPPGPVANPSAAAIEAVLAPADTPYRYFVARGQGRHTFTASYEDHKAAVRHLRQIRNQ